MNVPPLVTTGSVGDPRPGALGLPGTAVLFGGNELNTQSRSGVRGWIGYWFDEEQHLGIEIGGFSLEDETVGFFANSFGSPTLARPFFDVAPNPALFGQTIEGVAAPGISAGNVTVSSNSEFWGGEANLRSKCVCGPLWTVDFLAGFRTLGLDEDLNIQEMVLDLRPGMVGNTFLVNDNFQVENRFYGPQVGVEVERHFGNLFVNARLKVAFGSTEQDVQIGGRSVNTPAGGAPIVFDGRGLLAQPTNSGQFSRQVFSVVPEVGVNLGCYFTPHIRGHVGYNFLYWSRVVRPGNQIDFTVNSNQVAPPLPGGPNRPAFNFQGSDFWAQGLNFGLEFRW